MRTFKIISLLLIVTVIFVSCDLLSSPVSGDEGTTGPDPNPELLLTDADDTLVEDLVSSEYDAATDTTSFMAFYTDGSYVWYTEANEAAGEDWDGDTVTGEGLVLTDGERGTYTWDRDTLMLIISFSEEISAGEWVIKVDPYEAGQTTALTVDGGMYQALLVEGDTWVHTQPGIYGADYGTYSLSLTFRADGTFSEFSSSDYHYEASPDYRYESDFIGDYSVTSGGGYPFVEGTVHVIDLPGGTIRERTYDFDTATWSGWSENPATGVEHWSLKPMGRYVQIIEYYTD